MVDHRWERGAPAAEGKRRKSAPVREEYRRHRKGRLLFSLIKKGEETGGTGGPGEGDLMCFQKGWRLFAAAKKKSLVYQGGRERSSD